MADSTDETFMRLHWREAKKGSANASPNPAVGAVLVRGQACHFAGLSSSQLVCRTRRSNAWKQRASALASKRDALRHAGTVLDNRPHAALHECDLRAGIGRSVIGATDPNPLHGGRGIEQLRAAGIRGSRRACSRTNAVDSMKHSTSGSDRQSICDREMRDEPGRPPDTSA